MHNAQSLLLEEKTLCLAAASPRIVAGDVAHNARAVIAMIGRAQSAGADYLVLPELCLTGAGLGALYEYDALLHAASEALREICAAARMSKVMVSVGLPYRLGGKVQSCAALLRGERVHAIVPLRHNRTPFGFAPGLPASRSVQLLTPLRSVEVLGGGAAFGGLEAAAGEVVLMQSSANASAPSRRQSEEALRLVSARTGAAIAYAAPNRAESALGFVFDGFCAIAAKGEILASTAMEEESFVCARVDTGTLCPFEPFYSAAEQDGFLPADESLAREDCLRALELQAAALANRAGHIGSKGFVIGVSGGLDSALALLASVRAASRMGLGAKAVHGISMPGFGSSARTKNNARLLVEALGASYREIDIRPACLQHFADIGQDANVHDVVFENAQARERTQILLDISNRENLLDVGTGDLSEAALGFTTFGGDHLALYGVNASIPKTVIRRMVGEAKALFPEAADILQDILDTPVSPELLPPDAAGGIAQKTEELLGSYELHDLFLYEMLANKKSPKALLECAMEKLPFPREEAHRALGIFLKRFFSSQFKRCAAPEFPQIFFSLAPSAFPFPADVRPGAFMEEFAQIKL